MLLEGKGLLTHTERGMSDIYTKSQSQKVPDHMVPFMRAAFGPVFPKGRMDLFPR